MAAAGVAGTLLVMSSIPVIEARGKNQKRSRVVIPAPGPEQKSGLPVVVPGTGKEQLLFDPGRFRLESGPVVFGQVFPGEEKQLPGSVRVRVFADGGWVLKLASDSPLHNVDGDAPPVSSSRIAWRSDQSGGFVAFGDRQPAVIARGKATGEAGQLVLVDLRMLLQNNDDLGRYECTLHLLLETEPGTGRISTSVEPVLEISGNHLR